VRKLSNSRPWLLTERDLQEAVWRIETSFGLNWIAEAMCYAGEGPRVRPEAQLRRAGRAKKRPAASTNSKHPMPASV
jgi:hypothetical protein